MKLTYVKLVFLALLIFSCRSDLSNKIIPAEVAEVLPLELSTADSIRMAEERFKKLFERKVKFEDGEMMTIISGCLSKVLIDSIVTQKIFFKGILVAASKTQIDDSLFHEIRKSDVQEFEKITNIHSAFIIKLSEQDDTVHLDTKNSVGYHKVVDKKSRIYCTIYQLYSKNELVANIPIVEKIVEIKE